MWKLTIMQKRPSEHSDYTYDEKVAFMSDNLNLLCVIMANLAECEEACETTYKIEKAGEE